MNITLKLFTAALVLMIVLSFAYAKSSQKKFQQADTPTSGTLYNEITRQDSLLFDSFNKRDIDKLSQFFDQKLELYQDNTGVRNFNESMAAFKELFEKDYVLTRKLVPGSMEVYPLKDFGAIQTGQHIFSHIENGKPQMATYKFMRIWQKKDGIWRVTREITYGH